MKTVDMDALRLLKVEECAGHTIDYAAGWKACVDWIKTLPTVDAVPVVRCKDCKYGEMRKNYFGDAMFECSNPDSPVRDYALSCLLMPDWYCADGEAKEPEA